MRGFGKISPRNGSSFGLGGELAFADMDGAVRFVERIEVKQEGWHLPLHVYPWFRRLYFDGRMSGRFEFGFKTSDFYETLVLDGNNTAIHPALLAQDIISTAVLIRSSDRSRNRSALSHCTKILGLAYISATTNVAKLNEFPISDTLGSACLLESPYCTFVYPLGALSKRIKIAAS